MADRESDSTAFPVGEGARAWEIGSWRPCCLAKAPAGLREDAQDDLRKARLVAVQSETLRLVEKVGTTQGCLEQIGQTLLAAVTLGQTVATGAVRIGGLT
jgi:hypothetical protein